MENRLKTLVTGLLAILLTAVLFVLAFLGRNSALKAKEEKEEALKTASAYAEALAESAASMPAPVIPEELSEKDSPEKKPDTASYSDEAGLFAAFTANDTEIRDSLAALEQDDPELIKNYRIRVSLPKMETVDLPDGEWRRVRFSGKFEKKGKRDFAVIRINGDSGSFKGRILLSDIRFDDDKNLSLSGMSDEDVSTSFGAALRETGISSLKGEPCVSAVSEFTGDSELDRIALRIPLNDMDSSEFSTVKYDLYFEGTDSDLSFTTGCDFAGKASVDEELDKVNRAFVLYRGAAAAGQDPEENRSALLSGIDDMKNELKAWPDTDPLVIKVNDLLDKKAALAGGEPAEAAEDSNEETEDKEKEDKKGESAPAAVTPSYPVPSSDEVKTVPLVLIILTAVLLLAALIVLMLSSGKETEEEEPEEKGTAYLALKEAEEEKAELNKELLNSRNEKEELEARLSDTEMKVASAADFDAEEAIIDEIKEKTADLISSDSEKSDGKEREKELLNSVDAVRSSLSGLSENNTALNDSLKGIDTYLSETGDSVKSINSAADFISRIASETNLLALNASIEAARAGEAGRGFAVVADEISKLADETEKSVSEITDTVNKLNSDFDETGKHMDGILKLASDQGESIDEALKAFDETEGRIRSGSPDTAKEDLKLRKQAADEIVKLTDQLRTKLDYKRKELR